MHALSASEMLRIWEQGATRSLVDRALLLLGRGEPETNWSEIATLSIGERDRRLAQLRAATFGERMRLSAHCPECGEAVEFTLTAEQIGWGERSQAEAGEEPLQLEVDGARIRYRLPNSRDVVLAAASPAEDSEGSLLEACIVEATLNGRLLLPAELPEGIRAAVAAAMAQADPLADVTFELRCPACAHRWPTVFDIATVFWVELSQRAKRLLQEVDALARVYGWREAEVLALSPQRRALYVEMALT